MNVMTNLKSIVLFGAVALSSAYVSLRLFGPSLPAKDGSAEVVERTKADYNLVANFLGGAPTKKTLVEFFDFQCPPCRASYGEIHQIMAEHPSCNYSPVNFPLEIHPFAMNAAVASEVARAAGKYDKAFADMMTTNVALDSKGLDHYLASIGCEQVFAQGNTDDYRHKVKASIQLGKELKIHSTPTLMVLDPNGTLTEVRSYNELRKLLD